MKVFVQPVQVLGHFTPDFHVQAVHELQDDVLGLDEVLVGAFDVLLLNALLTTNQKTNSALVQHNQDLFRRGRFNLLALILFGLFGVGVVSTHLGEGLLFHYRLCHRQSRPKSESAPPSGGE